MSLIIIQKLICYHFYLFCCVNAIFTKCLSSDKIHFYNSLPKKYHFLFFFFYFLILPVSRLLCLISMYITGFLYLFSWFILSLLSLTSSDIFIILKLVKFHLNVYLSHLTFDCHSLFLIHNSFKFFMSNV